MSDTSGRSFEPSTGRVIQGAPPSQRRCDGKAAAGDGRRNDPDEVVFAAGFPGKEEQPNGVEDIFDQTYGAGLSFHHHTPRDAGLSIDTVSFQRNGGLAQCGLKFGSFSCSEDQGSVIDLVVDGKDVGMVSHPDGEMAHRYATQQVPTLVGFENFSLWC